MPAGLLRRRLADAGASSQDLTIGFVLAALSAFFNGSFPVCSRLGTPIDAVLFNGLVCVGVFLSSLFVPLLVSGRYLFTLGGAAGGVLFVFAGLFSFVAIPMAGLATAQAVWSCSAILVSFAWGTFGPSQIAAPVKDPKCTAAALVLLVTGALVIVNCDALAQRLRRSGGDQECTSFQQFPGQEGVPSESSATQEPQGLDRNRTSGIISALAVGVFGGSVLVPFKFIPSDEAGLLAVPSFGIGALVAGLAVSAGYWRFIKQEKQWPQIQPRTLLAGLLSGCLWNAGNVCSIVAQNPPYSLKYGIAYPILQCALFFGGLWGIYVFKEIRGLAIGTFWCGAVVLAGGVVMLGLAGPGA